MGMGFINYDDYYWGAGKTKKEAIEDLKSKVSDVVSPRGQVVNSKQGRTTTTTSRYCPGGVLFWGVVI